MHGSERQTQANALGCELGGLDPRRPALDPLERVAAAERSVMEDPSLRANSSTSTSPRRREEALAVDRHQVHDQPVRFHIRIPIRNPGVKGNRGDREERLRIRWLPGPWPLAGSRGLGTRGSAGGSGGTSFARARSSSTVMACPSNSAEVIRSQRMGRRTVIPPPELRRTSASAFVWASIAPVNSRPLAERSFSTGSAASIDRLVSKSPASERKINVCAHGGEVSAATARLERACGASSSSQRAGAARPLPRQRAKPRPGQDLRRESALAARPAIGLPVAFSQHVAEWQHGALRSRQTTSRAT